MKTNLLVAVFVVTTLIASVGLSQDSLFSGKGFGSNSLEMPGTSQVTKPRWPPKILDFSRDNSTQTARNPFSALFKKPTFQKPSFDLFKTKPNPQGIVDRRPSLADLFPKRDPNRPSLFKQMNTKSKNLLGKTADWFSGKNQDLKTQSSDTWNNVLSDFRDIQRKEGIAPANNSMTQRPNVRTADAAGQPRVRF